MIDKTDIKVIGITVGSVITTLFGEVDNLFILLLTLMVADFILGICDAIYLKKLSSSQMRKGILRKLAVFVVIAIAVRIDIVIVEQIPEGIVIADHKVTIRMFFLLYFCMNELLSVFENLDILGVPIPKALKKVLKSANDAITNEESPNKLLELIKRWLNKIPSKKADTEKVKDNKTEEEHNDTTEADSESTEEKEDSESE